MKISTGFAREETINGNVNRKMDKKAKAMFPGPHLHIIA